MRPMITTNASKLADTMHRRSKYPAHIAQAMKKNAAVVEKKAKQFTQRRFYSLETLRRMGHPYARRAPNPPVKPHIINRQSGAVHAGWRTHYQRTRDGARATVSNGAAHAKFLRGTRVMIARPVLEEAIKRTKRERDRNVRNARRRGLRASR